MKNQKLPTASKLTIVRQLCNYIPIHLVPKLARETGVDEQARTYDEWSHIVTLCYAQVTHSIGLNDVCDALQLNSGPLSAIRGARAPTRNNLSHANKVRDPIMAEKLFWAVYEHLGNLSPRFVSGKGAKRFARKFKRTIHVVDSTTIQLIASCMDWAKHRRRKAAAKCHLRLDLQSFLPRFAIIDTARQADAKRARELCAGIKEGEIVIFDKAYVDFDHLWNLEERGVFWVTRAKENLQLEVVETYSANKADKIICDELVGLKNAGSQKSYPQILRRIVAWVEVDGKERLMTFLTNHLSWSPESVVELYRCRWRIETFFKQIKQTLQLADFLGTSANAVRWQVWTALLVYLLLRYLAFLSNWAHSFSRLFAVVRTCLWRKWDLLKLLARYGTAAGSFRYLGRPEQAFFPGFI
ncbi:MAG: IS4 family transposase [Verrucomicrobia bacterium]|nr:MAG: IS4 family transposase [Verrucomicrobiota bacterium]